MGDDLNFKIIVHIGLPKCGSSTLQHIFSNNDKINFLGMIRDHETLSGRDIKNNDFFKYIVGKNNNIENARKIKSKLKIDKFNVISDESIIITDKINFKEKFNRIRNIFPNLKILLVIRNPVDMFISWHNFHIRGGMQEDFLTIENYFNSIKSQIPRDLVNIEEKISYIEKTFGKHNLYIVDFDKLVNYEKLNFELRKVFDDNFNLKKKVSRKNTSLSFLNLIYLKFPILYQFKKLLPNRIIKFLRITLMPILFYIIEDKYKNKYDRKKKIFLESKFINQISIYNKIKSNYATK